MTSQASGLPHAWEKSMVICSVDSCTRPVAAVGWCGTHYQRYRRFGALEVPDRIAACGHRVPRRPGPPRRLCQACDAARQPKPRQIVCAACSATFDVPVRSGRLPTYCSSRCKNWASAHPGEPLPPPRFCKWCGRDVTTKPNRRFCSGVCGRIVRGEVLYGPRQQLLCANPECGKPFLRVWGTKQRCCSERCGKRRWSLQAKEEGRTYREPWDDRRRDRYHRRRASKKATSTGVPVIRDQIGDRDRWKCGICGTRVNRNLAFPHSMSPSLDHIVPLSKGGAHSPENVQIAHLQCNTVKGNRGGGEQLLLIG